MVIMNNAVVVAALKFLKGRNVFFSVKNPIESSICMTLINKTAPGHGLITELLLCTQLG